MYMYSTSSHMYYMYIFVLGFFSSYYVHACTDAVALTRSTFMIWKRCEMSAGLAGRRERPDTKRMKRMRSSLLNDSSTCQNHWISSFDSSTSRYLPTQHAQ